MLSPVLIAGDGQKSVLEKVPLGKSVALEEPPLEEWKPQFGIDNRDEEKGEPSGIVATIVPRFFRHHDAQSRQKGEDSPAIADLSRIDHGQILLLDDPFADIEFVQRLNIPNPISLLGNLRSVRRYNPLSLLGNVPFVRRYNPISLLGNVPFVRRYNPLSLLGNFQNWHGYLTGEWGSNFDDFSKLRTNIIVYTGPAIAFDSEVNRWDGDRKRSDGRDDFYSGDFNMVYRFGKMRNIQFRTGAGVNWISNDGEFDLGLNSTVGFDLYMVKPWVFSSSLDWGRISSETLLHMRFLVGWNLQKFDLFVGYDFYEIGARERKGIVLGAGFQF